eukprot:gene14895-16577_t
MNALPDVIYHEILVYISYEDQFSFSMVDTNRSNLLLKRVRRIQLSAQKSQLYLTSQTFRDRIDGLVTNPYLQLKIRLRKPKIPKDVILPIKCLELDGVDTEEFNQLLIQQHFQEVQRLKVSDKISPLHHYHSSK